MAEPVALVAMAIEAGIGWPRLLYARIGHPVGGFAALILWCERRWNRPDRTAAARRLAGVATVILLLAATIAAALALAALAHALLGGLSWLATAALAWPALATRSLYDHVTPVARALEGGDLPAARAAVARIVGRDVAHLDEAGIARAATESLAESFCDGVAAPLLWLAVGGLPGVWAYKAINTADSLIGHREDRWRAFGWAAARGDDLANWLPARLAAVLLCIAGGGGCRVLARDHAQHASPNAGWPEAAMAGALGITLAGPVAYDGIAQAKPWIGDGPAPTARDLRRGLRLYLRACVLLAVIVGGAAWLR